MPTLDERINNRKNKKKRTITFKTLSIIFTDYNMNKNLNKKSIIDMNIELIQKKINSIEEILKNFNLNIKG